MRYAKQLKARLIILNYHSTSVFNNNQTIKYQAFRNPEVIVTTYGDERLLGFSESPCRYEQDEYGPTFVVIRPAATDEKLDKIASRFHLPIDDLKVFRSNIAR